MRSDRFFDTNVVLYGVAPETRKGPIVEGLMLEGGVISVQVLNECVAVCRGKFALSWPDIDQMLRGLNAAFRVTPVTRDTHDRGVSICRRYGFRVYDSLLLAAALEAGCTTFLSEDLQHGQVIDDVLTVLNPFQ